ncbi:MAG: agmatinase [Anaerolineales bacterium]|nr:agmatinase [Anaerolineales bacterium]
MPASAFGEHLQPFSGITSFMRCPATRDPAGADVVIVGVPYDSATSYRSGARFGPRAIRSASAMIWGYHNLHRLRPLDVLRVVDYGDVEVVPPSVTDTFRNTEAEVLAILETGATVLALGGDHSISLPLLRAHAKRFGPLSVVHFDSHPDTWDSEYPGQPYSHGTIYRRAIEEGLIRPEAYIQIGLRGSTGGPDDWDWARQRGVRVITMDEAAALGVPALIAAIRETASGPVFVTFDIDVADPAYAPGTGTPEVGGFTSHQLLQLVRGLKGLNLVGFDLVEVNPQYDHGDITALLAANIAFEFVALRALR